ncbi:unnamed protein product [Mytilus edulis]|uniref:Uncharacterized protein n=1 Tax=Mytilus edulis TaxID=6550 RepID=A0A8S3S9A1_MYTED|nr:unnamed protein product [Mytilus edulis]
MVGMLVTGSINTISKKAQNDCKVEGYPDRSANNTRTVHEFDHPWFQTLIMFFGEMICLGGYCIVRKKERDKRRREYAEQNKDMTNIPPQPRKLRVVHWCGMLVTMIGLVLVGCSSVFKSQHTAEGSKTILGIILILASQVVSASQMVIEEMFLKKRSLHPLQVVLPVMYFIPGSDVNNSYENSLDAIYQIFSEPRLLVFCLLYLLSIAFYNYFGLAVTKSLTAVHRTLIDACRTILVWVVDLLIFYAFDKDFGEPFDKTYGLLQVDGFLFLLIGTALYNELVVVPCIPCLRKPVPVQEVNVEAPNRGNIQYASDSDDDITRPLLRDKK